jgi:hypothetical protein
LYDPAIGAFTAIGSMNVARYWHTATLLPSGKVLIAGGAGMSGPGGVLSSAELFDPATGTFTVTGSMSSPRYGHQAVLLSNGKVLVLGGDWWSANAIGGVSTALASAEIYDPETGTFASTGSSTAAWFFPTATLLPSGNVLIAGNFDGFASQFVGANVYDVSTGTFSVTGNMTTPRANTTATLLVNAKVLIAGGYQSIDHGNGVIENVPLASAELYDPTTGHFTATGSMLTGQWNHTATLLPDSTVLVTGGGDDSAELYY